MLRVPHGHDYANMISQFDNEALESYWMLYIFHSPPSPGPSSPGSTPTHAIFAWRYLTSDSRAATIRSVGLSLCCCPSMPDTPVVYIHIVFIVIHARLLLSLVASIFNTLNIDLESCRQLTHNSHNYCPVRKLAQCVFLFRGLAAVTLGSCKWINNFWIFDSNFQLYSLLITFISSFRNLLLFFSFKHCSYYVIQYV